jgi:ABC-type multidrug transport system fused ATPase/permease subunit
VGGSIAYVPQTAWIRNASLRENVTFGQDDDEDKYVAAFAMICYDRSRSGIGSAKSSEHAV